MEFGIIRHSLITTIITSAQKLKENMERKPNTINLRRWDVKDQMVFKRDIVGEPVEVCRVKGIDLGCYCFIRDCYILNMLRNSVISMAFTSGRSPMPDSSNMLDSGRIFIQIYAKVILVCQAVIRRIFSFIVHQ